MVSKENAGWTRPRPFNETGGGGGGFGANVNPS